MATRRPRSLFRVPGRLVVLSIAGGFGLLGCGPNIVDEPTDYVGDDNVQIAMSCSDRAASVADTTYWAKFVVRAAPGVEVDWTGIGLQVSQVKPARRLVGHVTREGGGSKRIEAHFISADVPEGVGRVGPLVVPYRVGEMGPLATVSSSTCSPALSP